MRVPPTGITVELTAGLAGQQPSSILTWGAPSSLTGCVPEFTRSNRSFVCTSNGAFPRSTVVDVAVSASDEVGAEAAVGGLADGTLEQALRTSPESTAATNASRLIRSGTRMVSASTMKFGLDPSDTRAGGRFLHHGVASLVLPNSRPIAGTGSGAPFWRCWAIIQVVRGDQDTRRHDEPNLVDLVSGYLEHEGFEVVVATDGPSAVETARTFRPDLIILDLMLPGFDGLEVCRRVRQFSDAYVLMLTARGTSVPT